MEVLSGNGRQTVRLDLTDAGIDPTELRGRLRSVSDRRLGELAVLFREGLDAIDDALVDRPTGRGMRALRGLQDIEWDARDRTEARAMLEERDLQSTFSGETIEGWLDRHWPKEKERMPPDPESLESLCLLELQKIVSTVRDREEAYLRARGVLGDLRWRVERFPGGGTLDQWLDRHWSVVRPSSTVEEVSMRAYESQSETGYVDGRSRAATLFQLGFIEREADTREQAERMLAEEGWLDRHWPRLTPAQTADLVQLLSRDADAPARDADIARLQAEVDGLKAAVSKVSEQLHQLIKAVRVWGMWGA